MRCASVIRRLDAIRVACQNSPSILAPMDLAAWRRSVRRAANHYMQWEARGADRLSTWSPARRWLVLVMTPALLLCCSGTVIGAPLTRFVGETAKASKGAASPAAAVSVYLDALAYGEDAGLLPVLDDAQGDALMDQWLAYRAEMYRGESAPSNLEHGIDGSTPIGDGRASVQAGVYPVWWAKDGGGMSLHGTSHVWQFSTREDNGWQVETVTPYPWCGGYVKPSACV